MMRMTTGYRLSIPNRQKITEIRALRRGSDYTRHPRVTGIIRLKKTVSDYIRSPEKETHKNFFG